MKAPLIIGISLTCLLLTYTQNLYEIAESAGYFNYSNYLYQRAHDIGDGLTRLMTTWTIHEMTFYFMKWAKIVLLMLFFVYVFRFSLTCISTIYYLVFNHPVNWSQMAYLPEFIIYVGGGGYGLYRGLKKSNKPRQKVGFKI